MQQQSFFISMAELMIIVLFGALLSYVHHFLFPIPLQYQFIVSGLFSFFLGSLGPTFEEVIESILFFYIGIYLSLISPEIKKYLATNHIDMDKLYLTAQNSVPYFIQLVSIWILTIPLGLAFFYLPTRQYFRHKRFF